MYAHNRADAKEPGRALKRALTEARADAEAAAQPVDIEGTDQLRQLPEVRDTIAVYVDPDDPANVLAADADWEMHWYVYVLFVAGGLFLAVVVSVFLFD